MNLLITLPLAFGVTALLLVISFTFEKIAYQAVLPNLQFYGISLGIVMALAFNSAKFTLAWRIGNFRSASYFSTIFALLLYGSLSFIASFLVYAAYADSPNLDRLLRSERAKVAASYDDRLQSVRDATEKDITTIQARYRELRNKTQQNAQQHLDELEKARQAEMKITDANGNFIGRRYKEIMRLIKLTKENRDARIDELNQKEEEEIKALRATWQEREKRILTERDKAVSKITRESLRDSEAAQSRWLTAGPHLLNRMFGWEIDHSHLALLLSILTALIVEFGPLVLITPVARDLSRLAGNASSAGPSRGDEPLDRPTEDHKKDNTNARARTLRAVD